MSKPTATVGCGRRIMCVVLVAVGAALCVLALLRYRRSNLVYRTAQVVGRWTDELVMRALVEDPPFALPPGDLKALCAWLRTEPWWEERYGVFAPGHPPEGFFRDAWGRPLVYRFPPASDTGLILELYSVGPNATDEKGKGDDIASTCDIRISEYANLFEAGVVDPAWIWQRWPHLRRSASGKIIGAPPERLKEVEGRREAAPE